MQPYFFSNCRNRQAICEPCSHTSSAIADTEKLADLFDFLGALHPPRHRRQLTESANFSLVPIKLMVSVYRSFLLSAIFLAKFFISFLEESEGPPVQVKTRGLKVLFSILIIRVSYFLKKVFRDRSRHL